MMMMWIIDSFWLCSKYILYLFVWSDYIFEIINEENTEEEEWKEKGDLSKIGWMNGSVSIDWSINQMVVADQFK